MKKNILLVEDEPDLNQTISFNLDSEGYSVESTFNGTDALKSIDVKLPDLILEAYTYRYLKNTTDALSDYFVGQVEPGDNQNKKQNLQEDKL